MKSFSILSATLLTLLSVSALSSPELIEREDIKENSIGNCHFHDTTQFCTDLHGTEGEIIPSPEKDQAPTSYSGCHLHDDQTFCLDLNGKEIEFVAVENEKEDEEEESHSHASYNVTGCHFHGDEQHCKHDEIEGTIVPSPEKSDGAPKSYSNCHAHGEKTFCLKEDGKEVEFVVESTNSTTSSAVSSTMGITSSVKTSSLNGAINVQGAFFLQFVALALALI